MNGIFSLCEKRVAINKFFLFVAVMQQLRTPCSPLSLPASLRPRMSALSPNEHSGSRKACLPKGQSAGALGQASASPKGKVGFVAHIARCDLQCFVGDVEGKYFFLLLNIQHGF